MSGNHGEIVNTPYSTSATALDVAAGTLNTLGTIWIFALMLLICADIACRALFNAPLNGVTEISGFSVVAIVFLQLPSTARARRLIRADFMIEALHRSSPRIAAAIEVMTACIGMAVFAAILWSAVIGLTEAWNTNDSYGIEQVFTFLKWPIWLILALGSGCTLIALAAQVVVDADRLRQTASPGSGQR